MDKKRWCGICKFNTYGCAHPSATVPPDRLVKPIERLGLLSFCELAIAPFATAVVRAAPQTYFRPLRLVVPPEIGPTFTLVDLKVGHVTLFVGHVADGVSMSLFPPQPSDRLLINNLAGSRVMHPGEEMFLVVTNRCHDTRNFNALVYGDALDALDH